MVESLKSRDEESLLCWDDKHKQKVTRSLTFTADDFTVAAHEYEERMFLVEPVQNKLYGVAWTKSWE